MRLISSSHANWPRVTSGGEKVKKKERGEGRRRQTPETLSQSSGLGFVATGGPDSEHPLGPATTFGNPPYSLQCDSTPVFFVCLFVLSTGGSPRSRHRHPALPRALREHPHDHLAGHCLCLQGTANGTRGKSYLELPRHVNLLYFPVSSNCSSHFMHSLIAFEYLCSSGLDQVTTRERKLN